MKTLHMEWKHLEIEGETCDRCCDTGETLQAEIKRLNQKLAPEGVHIQWTETKLQGSELNQSNSILLDGVPLEEILDIRVSENHCPSCSALLKKESYCRTIFYEGEEYEDIPAQAIRAAVVQVLGLNSEEPFSLILSEPSGGCGCQEGCCGEKVPAPSEKVVTIDLLYLDLSVCTRCQGTEETLLAALEEVTTVLLSAGIKVALNKVHVLSEELARKHAFLSSPTIRVNGHDIQLEGKESLCASCEDLCGDQVDCRVWEYNGVDYEVPPKAMVIHAILKEVYSAPRSIEEKKAYVLPENLKRFYRTMKEKKETISCC